VTSNDQPRRLVAAAVSPGVFETYGGFIGENHVVILEPTTDSPSISPDMLVRLLSAHSVDRFFRCISGATNVSAFELNQLALPNPEVLEKLIPQGWSMDETVRHAYGVPPERQAANEP
jgi:adenine-specific DNA-methyltransferase